MSADPESDFQHHFVPGTSARTLILLHGTGGNENSLLSLGKALDPTAALLSPRGQVLENGMPRFFRRLAEGIFDEADLIRRTHELADLLLTAAAHYGLDSQKGVAVGYSNGANIAASLLLLRPEVLAGAVLFRPMVPLVPATLPNLAGKPVLISAGHHDPLCPPEQSRELTSLLQRAGAEVQLEFEKAGHELTDHTIHTAQAWLNLHAI